MATERVEISVTHEIMIGGEKSWIRYAVTETAENGETAEDARLRCSKHVNEGVMRTIYETVETVRDQ